MSGPTLVVIACCAVLVVLLLGLDSFRRGGEYNRNNANRFMRWRIGLQAVAVLLIVVLVWLRQENGG